MSMPDHYLELGFQMMGVTGNIFGEEQIEAFASIMPDSYSDLVDYMNVAGIEANTKPSEAEIAEFNEFIVKWVATYGEN